MYLSVRLSGAHGCVRGDGRAREVQAQHLELRVSLPERRAELRRGVALGDLPTLVERLRKSAAPLRCDCVFIYFKTILKMFERIQWCFGTN